MEFCASSRLVPAVLINLVSALACSPVNAGSGFAEPVRFTRIPTRFEEGRIYVMPVTTAGDTLSFILDSGLDDDLFSAALATRLQLPHEGISGDPDAAARVALPPLAPKTSIPQPSSWAQGARRFHVVPIEGQGLLIARPRDAGALGAPWLAERVWTFDYPRHQLLLLPPKSTPAIASDHRVALGFKTDSLGRRTTQFPSLPVTIDGESLYYLFDTGATMNLTDSALVTLADGRPARRAGSFVIQSVFERWRRHHPDWRVIEGAEYPTHLPMIQVPVVEIGGYSVGPVWFIARPDRGFIGLMGPLMDRPIVGSLGGSALKYLRVTVDYPHAIAYFER